MLTSLVPVVGLQDNVELSHNKKPKWDVKREFYVLDFKRRATEASVKNFLLVTDEDPEHDSVLFGKRGDNEFNVDVQCVLFDCVLSTACLNS